MKTTSSTACDTILDFFSDQEEGYFPHRLRKKKCMCHSTEGQLSEMPRLCTFQALLIPSHFRTTILFIVLES